MNNSIHRHAPFSTRILHIADTSVWIVALILLIVNYFNFAAVYYTLEKDGSSLAVAESLLGGLCHRMPSRSFWLFEVPLGLCSRCTGLYLFAFLTVLVVPFSSILRIKNVLAYSSVAILPLLIDSILEHYSVYAGNNIIRFSTGALFGYGIIALVKLFFNNFIPQLNNRR